MSVCIALKYNDGVLLAGDKQMTYGGHLKFNNGVKIQKSTYSNTAVGSCGDKRVIDLIFCNMDDLMEYKDILDNIKIDYKYVVKHIVNNIFSILDRNGCLYKENNVVSTTNEFIVASNENIYLIYQDGSVLECDNYGCIGSGYELVKGYLDTLDLQNLTLDKAKKIIINCIQQCCNNEIYINDNIDLIKL